MKAIAILRILHLNRKLRKQKEQAMDNLLQGRGKQFSKLGFKTMVFKPMTDSKAYTLFIIEKNNYRKENIWFKESILL